MALQRAVYRPRDAEHTVPHPVVAEHLEAFLGAVAEAGSGAGLPQFVEREFREFLTCGVFDHGVARFRCEGCAREHLPLASKALGDGKLEFSLGFDNGNRPGMRGSVRFVASEWNKWNK